MFVSNNMFVVNGDNGNLPSGQILHELGYKNEHHELPNTQIHENRSLEIIESTHDPDRNIGADRSGSGPVAIPYKINMEMDVMNNDILDLSKPIRGYPLRKGVSNISLDSLNDNYMDTVDTLKTMSQGSGSREGSLENLLELSRTIQDYHTAEQFSEFERWNNLVNLKKSATNYVADDLHCDTASEDTNFVDLANSEGPCLETARESLAKKEPLFFGDFNQTQKCRSISSQIHHQLYGPLLHSAPVENSFSNSTMSITTTSSLKSADFASSPESYEMLYKSFEIAAYMDEEDRKQGRQLSPSVPNIEMLSPKLQRLRQMCDGMPTSPKPNFCSHRESLERFEEEEAKAELASRKVTFADLAQQKKKQEQEEVRPQSLPFQPSQHWTELLSSSRTPDYAMQFHQTDGLSPRRPHTLPIGLRHVTKPSSRPFPKDVTPECVKSQENVHCDKLESRVSRTFSAPEGFTQYNQDYGVKNENDNMYHCFEKPAFYAAENCNPVKVKQSQKNQILEQDLLGEVVYVQNKPLKPIYMVDADYNRRKGLSPPPGLISAPVPIPLPQPITGCQKPALPPSIDYADPPTFFGYDVPPIDIPISAYEEFDNCIEIDISQKKGFVSAMNCAVDIVVNHFGKTRDPLEKRKLGDTECTPDIGHMILQYVCPGIASILTDGLQPYGRSVIVGRIKNNIWNVVEATTKLGPGTKQLNDVVAHIINLKNLTDSMVKFNAFIFGLLNTGCLEQWLLHLNSREDILDGFYKPDAFLVLCKSPLKQLFDDLVLAILPLTILPFKLDYKFEYNYIQEMKLRDKGKQKLQEEFEKANTFSPFQLMKKMTQKTRQKIAQSSKQGCTMPDNFSASDANSGAGGGWSVGWMKSLVSSGCKEDDVSQKYPPITASPVKKGMCLPRLKVDTSSKMDQTPKWSLFGPSVAKALNNIKDDTPTLGMKSILSLTPRSRRRMLGKEKAIPDHFAEELMGPRPDPAGSSDGYSSSPEWNISCTRKVLVRRKTRSKTARVV
uniref:Uncharacterized protein LOC102802905 n=1 Tax=Saccoglossus kowalevskii TaxID=10224 RepID=A0ABM0MMB7_SACKO|nr:PREDICTED: uncharacterized protein LOC102802905 [Saccoglossus kowalevskii]